MSFNEKLQNLRKKNKLSQEELASKLDVTRQSVSKWESGITYPEMDKLLSMCKIFNCSLEELTNDNIKEIGAIEKKNNINSLVDSVLEIINKAYHYFLHINFKEFMKCVITMTIVFLILLILKKPIDSIESTIYNMLDSFNKPVLTNFGYNFFKMIFDIAYYVLFVLLFIYIFKIGFLDKVKIEEKVENKESDNSQKDSSKTNDKKVKEIHEHNYTFFTILGSIIMFFIKVFLVFLAIPFVLILIAFCAFLVIDIYLMFRGLFYFSVFLGIISCIALVILCLEFMFNILFNKKHSYKRMLITFVAGICGVGLSIGLFTLNIGNIKYYNKEPNIKISNTTYTFDYNKDLVLTDYYETKYVVDNNLKNEVRIEASYYSKYYKLSLKEDENFIYVIDNNTDYIRFKDITDLVIHDLKDNKLYNYDLLFEPKFVVTSSEENINQIKKNSSSLYQNEYQDQVDDCDKSIDNLEKNNEKLETENESLKTENEELKAKIDEYKSKIKEILD